MKTPILGSSYVARSVNAADNRMVNLFPEIVPEGGKEPAFLRRAPGLFVNTPAGIGGGGSGLIRGMYVVGTNMYVVSGQNFYQVDLNGNATNRGTVSDTLPVSMADNGTQLFIANSQTGTSYIYNMSTHAYAQITDPDFPAAGAGTVGYLDGFFVFNERNSQKVWVTDLLDGSSITATNFASAEAASDRVVSVLVNGDELWVFGSTTTEVWYNTGAAGFPFAPIQGAFTEMGCAAAFSVAKIENTIFWLGSNAQGSGVVYKANGYRGERISTHAVEKWIEDYIWAGGAGGYSVSEAIAYTYQQDGHLFYVLVLLGSDTSWVYDVTTGVWHERAGWNGSAFTQYPAVWHAFHRGTHWTGSYNSAVIYELIQNQSTILTFVASKWLRSWRAIAPGQNNLKRTLHHSLQLDCETGVGNDVVANPTVSLRWSDDGGHTWSTGSSLTMGASGNYSKRLIWRRLGATMKLRDRVYEVSGTDQANIYIMGAEIILSPTDA